MKKLLSLLSVLTISGTAVPTTIAASPYQKEETIKNSDINYQQENNLGKLKRTKRANNDKIENYYCFLCHNRLVAKISHNTWKKIADNYAKTGTLEQDRSYVRTLLNNFEKRNSSGDLNAANYFSDDDIKILANVIVDHFVDINQIFLNKNNDNIGLFIRTNRNSYWENNDYFWGAHPNIKENEFKHSVISGVGVFLTPKLWNLITLYYNDNLSNFDKYAELFIDRVYNNSDTLIEIRSEDFVWKIARIIWNNWEKINNIWENSDKNNRIKIKMDFSIENKSYLKQDVYLKYFNSEIEETNSNMERNI